MITLTGSSLTIEQLIAIADEGEQVTVAPEAIARVRAARDVVDRKARGDEPVYGINTGCGLFADVKIAPDALETLQLRRHVPTLDDDRRPAPDIARIAALIASGELEDACGFGVK
jgi:histidine ammonia-lyase